MQGGVTAPTVALTDVNGVAALVDGVSGTKFIATISGPDTDVGDVVVVSIARGAVLNANLADVNKAATTDDTLGSNERALIQFTVVGAELCGAMQVGLQLFLLQKAQWPLQTLHLQVSVALLR